MTVPFSDLARPSRGRTTRRVEDSAVVTKALGMNHPGQPNHPLTAPPNQKQLCREGLVPVFYPATSLETSSRNLGPSASVVVCSLLTDDSQNTGIGSPCVWIERGRFSRFVTIVCGSMPTAR